MKKKIVIFTGAGISAESGIATFRDKGGLWEQYDLEEVATTKAWSKNRAKVLDFFNLVKASLVDIKPNAAHYALAELEKEYDVVIITQNIDNLHEIAGSTNVLHIHGDISKSKSTFNPKLVYPCEGEIKIGDACEAGSQLRHDVVLFGDPVPMMNDAVREMKDANYFVVIGTSLQVYPAATIMEYIPAGCETYVVDPMIPQSVRDMEVTCIPDTAVGGVPFVVKTLLGKVEK